MKAVFLAGGFGTRLSEETSVRPKPMVEIGGRPILWHIMKGYSVHGIHDFVICLGYKAQVVKEYFANYYVNAADVTFDLAANRMTVHSAAVEPWRVTLVDTGENTMTGGRLKRIAPLLGDETFCFAYGDCVSDVDITRLIEFHRAKGVLATLTAIRPPGRFGALTLEEGEEKITGFREKPEGEGGWVNGGFFVLEPRALGWIGPHEALERDPLERMAAAGELAGFRHEGFWDCMDTFKDTLLLNELWARGEAPWRPLVGV
jgi:glucose-1-phosphate cytidylyltransferase